MALRLANKIRCNITQNVSTATPVKTRALAAKFSKTLHQSLYPLQLSRSFFSKTEVAPASQAVSASKDDAKNQQSQSSSDDVANSQNNTRYKPYRPRSANFQPTTAAASEESGSSNLQPSMLPEYFQSNMDMQAATYPLSDKLGEGLSRPGAAKLR